jgi:hypothetical protein
MGYNHHHLLRNVNIHQDKTAKPLNSPFFHTLRLSDELYPSKTSDQKAKSP